MPLFNKFHCLVNVIPYRDWNPGPSGNEAGMTLTKQ